MRSELATIPHRSRIPVLEWLSGYRHEWLRRDLVAGCIAAAVVIPKAMAYGSVAGLPVQAGIYAVLVPMAIYALLGTSRVLSVSTTTTIAILVGAELNRILPGADVAALLGAVAMMSLMVGAVLVLAAVLRLGFLANLISEPVLVGFKAGIAVVIVVDQIPKLLNIHIPRGGILQNIHALIQGLPDTSLATLALSVAMLALLIGIEHVYPRLPAPLIAVATGIAAMTVFQLHHYGVETIGAIPAGLPGVVLPDFSLANQLWAGALGIALMSFTETIAAGRAFAGGDDPPLRPNQELLATGLANVGGAFIGAVPAGGGTTQTAVNRLAGAQSQAAQLVTAATALLTILFLGSLLGLMPQATLAAIVIVYSAGLIKPAEFRAILRVRRTEFIWALIALSGVILLGTLKGILVAIIASMIALAYQSADPPVNELGRKPGTNVFRPRSREHEEDEVFPGLLLVRPEGRIFFGNAERIAAKVRQLAEGADYRVVALHLRGVPDLEYTALKMLVESEIKLRAHGIQLWLVGLNPSVLTMIQRSPLGEVLDHNRLHFNLEIAVAHYLASGLSGSPREASRDSHAQDREDCS